MLVRTITKGLINSNTEKKPSFPPIPLRNILEQIVTAKILDVNFEQLTLAMINGDAAQLVEDIFHVHIIVIAHVNDSPHARVMAHIPPSTANSLCI